MSSSHLLVTELNDRIRKISKCEVPIELDDYRKDSAGEGTA